MNRLLSIIKVNLKCGPSDLNMPTSEKSKKRNTIIQIFFLIFLLVFVAVPFGAIGYTQGLAIKGLDINIFKILIPAISITIPLLTLAFILTNLFLNSDDETFLALPITPKEIYTSRLVTSIIQSYLFILMFFAPSLFGLILGMGLPFDTYLSFIIFIMLSPFIPVALVSFLFTLLSKFINYKKHKSVLNVIMMIFPVIIILGMQYITNFVSMEGGNGDPNQMIEAIRYAADSIGNILCCISFISIPSVISFSANNVLIRLAFMLLSVIITFIIFYVLILLSSKLYYPYLLKHEGNKTNNKAVVDKDFKSTSTFKALVLSDLKEIIRSPIYSMNFIFPIIMMPIIMVISFIFGFNSEGGNFLELVEQIKQFIDFNNPFVITTIIAMIVFFSSMSFASITAFSRFGKNSFFVKMIPVKPIKIILSRVVFGFISSFLLAVIILIGLTAIGLIDVINTILSIITIIPIILTLNLVSISIDLWKPYLSWSNENQLMKNGIKTAVYMFASWIGAGLFVGIGALFYFFIPNSGYILMALITIIFIIICLLLYKHLNKEDIFKKL